MNRTLVAAAVGACILAIGTTTPAMAAKGEPKRPDGPVVSVLPSDNGGDNGWGNCGHNSSGGHRPLEGGNGGFTKGDSCLGTVAPTDPTVPVDGPGSGGSSTPEAPTEPTDPTDPKEPTDPTEPVDSFPPIYV